MTTIRATPLLDEYVAAIGLQTLSREIELNSENVERRLVEVRRQHPEETPEQQYARAVARELWFNYPRLRRDAPPERAQIQPAPVESFVPMLEKIFEKFTEACHSGLGRKAAQEVQPVTLRLTMWQKFALYFWMVLTLGLLGVIAARGQGGQGPMIEALDEGVRVRFFAAGVFRWNCIGAGVTCTWNPITRRIDLTVAGGGAAHELLSPTHTGTVPAAPVRGDLIVGSAVPDWQRFARGTAGQVLRMNPAGIDPAWEMDDPFDPSIFAYDDDFVGGAAGGGSANIGALGWHIQGLAAGGGGSSDHELSVYPHLGVQQLRTGATQFFGYNLSLAGPSPNVNPLGNLAANVPWKMLWIFKLNGGVLVTTFTTFRIGLSLGASNLIEPANGIWLRYDTNVAYGDVAFHYVCRSGGVNTEPAGPPVAAVDNNWHKLQIWSTVAGTVWFQFDALAPVSIAAGIPVVSLAQVAIIATDTAAARDVHLDKAAFKMTGLAR